MCNRSSFARERNCIVSWSFDSDGSSLFRNNSVRMGSECMVVGGMIVVLTGALLSAVISPFSLLFDKHAARSIVANPAFYF